jgi:putative glutamine amidotransferase
MKKIGILVSKYDTSLGISAPYYNYFEKFGKIVFVSFDEYRTDIDLLVLTGGPDVNPQRYGAKPEIFTTKPCIFKEYFDSNMLGQYIGHEIPIFGICRGLQALVVEFGGKLIQHINHPTSDERWEMAHKVIYNLNGHYEMEEVNSLHHQAASAIKFPYNELTIIGMATSLKNKSNIKELGLIEAIRHNHFPIAAVQYHPEELGGTKLSDFLVTSLLEGASLGCLESLFETVPEIAF